MRSVGELSHDTGVRSREEVFTHVIKSQKFITLPIKMLIFLAHAQNFYAKKYTKSPLTPLSATFIAKSGGVLLYDVHIF